MKKNDFWPGGGAEKRNNADYGRKSASEIPWSTKNTINLLLEQLEAKVSPFWNASTIGNPKNAFLAKNP